MHAWDIIAYHYDGAAYCPDCRPVKRERESEDEIGEHDADSLDSEVGATCDNCRACLGSDGEWCNLDVVTDDRFYRWSRCSHCNAQKPVAAADLADYFQDRKRYGCQDCGRGPVRIQSRRTKG